MAVSHTQILPTIKMCSETLA